MLLNLSLHAILITAFATSSNSYCNHPRWRSFPEYFRFGVGTSAYQIEGGWNASAKGESIWDRYFHTKLIGYPNGDVACDSYNEYERDIDMVKQLNVSFYRFSLSWSRLFRDGSYNIRNPDGFRYYNALINGLLLQGIEPVVTLFHWDLPQPLENIGGWTNPYIQDYFLDYANECFMEFGDRVKTWLTINDPHMFCTFYSALIHEGNPELALYKCGHNVLISHAKAYKMYDTWYRPQQRGQIGISLETSWFEPATFSPQDITATERALEFELGWFAHPIFSMEGGYPPVMKYQIDLMSKAAGYPMSRLPEFTWQEIDLIKGSSDFFGLNHHISTMVMDNTDMNFAMIGNSNMEYHPDINVFTYSNQAWHESGFDGISVYSKGFYNILIHIMNTYGNPEIRIYANGFPTADILIDEDRIKAMSQYLNAMMDAMEAGARVSMYCFWTLMDNLEWTRGYGPRFGLYAVDFNDPLKRVTPKKSAKYYRDLATYKQLKQVTYLDLFYN